MPVIIHPPDHPFDPDHPFATPCILFVPRRRSSEASPVQNAPENGLDTVPPNDASTDIAYARFPFDLQKNLDGKPRAEQAAVIDTESPNADKTAAQVSGERDTRSARLSLIPPRPHDLEDIAFEILRQARYKNSKRLG